MNRGTVPLFYFRRRKNGNKIYGEGEALGMMYGKNLTEALGFDNVSFIMNSERYEKNKETRKRIFFR